MKILLIADEESPYLWDYYRPGMLGDIDLILSCGDLKANYLEFLVTMLGVPLCYVHGNHDGSYQNFPPEGCECIDDRVVWVNGIRILGLGGSIQYSGGPYQYTQQAMNTRIRKLRFELYKSQGVDIILTHAPAAGFEHATDRAHKGFESFPGLMDRYQPKYLIHGHVHKNYGLSIPSRELYGNTTIVNACGWQILEYNEPPIPARKGLLRMDILDYNCPVLCPASAGMPKD